MAPKILFVLTSHSQLGNTGNPTGWYLPELAHPYTVLSAAGAEITLISPKGGAAPLDPSSVSASSSDSTSQEFLKTQSKLWETTQPLSSFLGKADGYDALFYVGGHGPMFDLKTDGQSHELIREFWEKGKVVSAVCHGPAALVDVKLKDGGYLVGGREVTGFTNVEEDQVGLTGAMPYVSLLVSSPCFSALF